jgi:hypothetical protein
MSNISEQELDRLLREVVKRSLVDSDFRAKALSNGTSAVKSVSDKPIPEGYTFTFVENRKGNNRTVALPPMVSDKDQLLAEDLEQVAGGVMLLDPCNGTCGQGSCITT